MERVARFELAARSASDWKSDGLNHSPIPAFNTLVYSVFVRKSITFSKNRGTEVPLNVVANYSYCYSFI